MTKNIIQVLEGNGLTSARHDVLSKYLKNLYPESFDPEVPNELTYCGSKKLTDTLDGLDLDIGRMLLSPTSSYAPLLKMIFDNVGRNKNKWNNFIALVRWTNKSSSFY